jgi:hypothetical protein
VDSCERRIPRVFVARDLFNIFDIIALGHPGQPGIFGVQATSGSNHASRRAKIVRSEAATRWIANGGHIMLVSWTKKKNGERVRWSPRVENIVALDATSEPQGAGREPADDLDGRLRTDGR